MKPAVTNSSFTRCWTSFMFQNLQTSFLLILSGTKINSLANLNCLDNLIHSMFDNETLRLVPLTPQHELILVFSNHIGSYFLRIEYKKPLTTPELIQSTRIVRTNRATIGVLYPLAGSLIKIKYIVANAEQYMRTIPYSGFFALSLFISQLKDICIEVSTKSSSSLKRNTKC